MLTPRKDMVITHVLDCFSKVTKLFVRTSIRIKCSRRSKLSHSDRCLVCL